MQTKRFTRADAEALVNSMLRQARENVNGTLNIGRPHSTKTRWGE